MKFLIILIVSYTCNQNYICLAFGTSGSLNSASVSNAPVSMVGKLFLFNCYNDCY